MKTLLLLVAVSLASIGCNPIVSQPDARDMATDRSCDWAASCNSIGPGKTYETRDACEIALRNLWNGAWPASGCENKINANDLNACLNRIDTTSCNNILDVLGLVTGVCSQTTVCAP